MVVKDGKLYDQWVRAGIDIDAFKKRFDCRADMEFGFWPRMNRWMNLLQTEKVSRNLCHAANL
ncbi:hypothetical protein ACGFZG_24650 [Streptomyces antibioticus]|uniref:hypothetical protein n=1 Tax=Streptomyces antibioticus TaxID=1890 RepID=UPI0036FD7962